MDRQREMVHALALWLARSEGGGMENAAASSPAVTVHSRHPELLDAEGHVCAFFHSLDEEYQVLLPFIKEGFGRGERIFYIVDPELRAHHLTRLSAAGIDVAAGQASGQLVMLDWSQTYLSTGRFDQDLTMRQFAGARADGRKQGYPRTRFVAHMEWALKGSINQLAEYEMTSNVAPLGGDVAICTYQLEHWGGRLLVSALRSHPLVILGGLLHENPFYVAPTPLRRS
jgi:hypothetical protein